MTVDPDASGPIIIRLMSQRGGFSPETLLHRFPNHSLDHGDIVFTLNDKQPADVVVIQNYLKYDEPVTAREGYIWKWDNEPLVARPVAPGYDRVYTHLDIPSTRSTQVVTSPPILDWWVGKSYDELVSLPVPHKSAAMSAIASTKQDIPGHVRRHQFIEDLIHEFPEIDVFGHGRERPLTDKWDGIGPYRYSLAIENTSKPDYWSEKITDCFVSYTVPLYFGATNIDRYFPSGSYIWLPIDNPERAFSIVRETLESDDWASRLDALKEAREACLRKYSFFSQISERVRAESDTLLAAHRSTRMVHGRRNRPGGWVRGAGVMGNLRARKERRRQRLLRGKNSNPDGVW